MISKFIRPCALALLALLGASGCAGTTSPDQPGAEATGPAGAAAEGAPGGAPTTTDTAPAGATAALAATHKEAPRPFSPPFPDRLDLFEPPKRAQSMVRRADEHGETVELKGFVTVDEPRVVLAIDGVIAPIPEGGEKYGVEVISIHPPSVVLQRGRARWTATLE